MRKISLILSLLILSSSLALAQGKWRKFHGPEVGPGPRSGHGMVVDEARQKIVFFGGEYFNEEIEWDKKYFNDTWEFDLKTLTWEKKEPSTHPRERADFAIAYSPVSKKVVIQGGRQIYDGNLIPNGNYSPSTWEWNGNEWKFITTSGPSRRELHNMVWNPSTSEIVLFGGTVWRGLPGDRIYLNDIWVYSENQWKELTSSDAPRGRSSATMVFDSTNNEIVLYGGQYRSKLYLKDTFSWDGNKWLQISDEGPGYRSHHAAAFNPDNGKVILFGGFFQNTRFFPNQLQKWFNDTWEFTDNAWSRINIKSEKPSPREDHKMVYDSINKRIWLFGGKFEQYSRKREYFGDLWYYTIHNEYDLKPLIQKVSPGNKLEHGKTARFTVRIHNLGLDESKGHKVSLFLSKDDQLSNDDKLLIAKQFKRHIKPNSKADFKIAKKISKNIAPGKYYLIIKALSDSGIDLNKENNIRVRKNPVTISH